MSVQNPERLATKQDLKDMYDRIRPYMGGLVTSKAGFTPVGTVISVMGTTAPVNYLACDGTVYNIADYTELANYFNEQFGSTNFFGGNGTTTFAVPDLRGEFLRGTGTNSHTNQGSGASVGVHQDGTIHVQVDGGTDSCIYSTRSARNKFIGTEDSLISHGGYSKSSGGTNATDNNWNLFTSRPTNTSVLYCIATKNFYIDPTLDYSTDEKVVGTWIDGKPLWQKTVVINNPVKGRNQVGFDVSGVINAFGVCYPSNGAQELSNGDLFHIGIGGDYTSLYLYLDGITNPTKAIITVQYTKATT